MLSPTPLALLVLLLPTLLQALPVLPPTGDVENPWVPVLALGTSISLLGQRTLANVDDPVSADAPALPVKHLRLQRVDLEEDPVAVAEGVEMPQRWIWAPDTYF